MSALRKAFCNSVIIWNAPQEYCQLLLAGHITQYLGDLSFKKKRKKAYCVASLFLQSLMVVFGCRGQAAHSQPGKDSCCIYAYSGTQDNAGDRGKNNSVSAEKSGLGRKSFSYPINTYMFLEIPVRVYKCIRSIYLTPSLVHSM